MALATTTRKAKAAIAPTIVLAIPALLCLDAALVGWLDYLALDALRTHRQVGHQGIAIWARWLYLCVARERGAGTN